MYANQICLTLNQSDLPNQPLVGTNWFLCLGRSVCLNIFLNTREALVLTVSFLLLQILFLFVVFSPHCCCCFLTAMFRASILFHSLPAMVSVSDRNPHAYGCSCCVLFYACLDILAAWILSTWYGIRNAIQII